MILAGRPAPLSECRILNMSKPSITVGCQEGFDGGLPQIFLLEVYENEQLKTKMTNQKPFFEISQVDYGQPVKLFVFAQNVKGSSEPFIIEETFGKARQQAVEGRHTTTHRLYRFVTLSANFGTNTRFLFDFEILLYIFFKNGQVVALLD